MSTPKAEPYKVTQRRFRLASKSGRWLRDGERPSNPPTHSAQRREKRHRKMQRLAAEATRVVFPPKPAESAK